MGVFHPRPGNDDRERGDVPHLDRGGSVRTPEIKSIEQSSSSTGLGGVVNTFTPSAGREQEVGPLPRTRVGDMTSFRESLIFEE
jgi:hypothetical protein